MSVTKQPQPQLQSPRSSTRRSLAFAETPSTPTSNESKKNNKKRISRYGCNNNKSNSSVDTPKRRRVYYKNVSIDGGEFSVGDDVYVKRREGAESDNDDPEVEECRICFTADRKIMIECDDCLGGFHLKCLKPPLKKVPEGDWDCPYCVAKKVGNKIEMPKPPPGKTLRRTFKEKLLSSDLWAARIERLWKEPDSRYMLRCRWYIIPEETAAGRQPHNLRRELYLTNDFGEIEMESILRHCYVMSPKEYAEAGNEGDDVFYCEYEYDIHWHSFKRIVDVDDEEVNDEEDEKDEDWKVYKDSAVEDSEYEDDAMPDSLSNNVHVAANSHRRTFGLQRIGMKRIPEHVRWHKQTEMEKAKLALMLSTLPKSLPCRTREMEKITAFIKGAISNKNCLGRCLYIHGIPGTGKTLSVHAVMESLRTEVDAGSLRPYCFVEVNGLKLASPENIYKVIYEAISGHRVGWRKALQCLNERFSEANRKLTGENRPCVLLIDEFDLLLTRNQSVLYNVLDWPTKPNSSIIIIGISNTMDLPEKLLPRISSRMGIQRLCFDPYNYRQLQEILLSRLKDIDAFEDQAIEFASRKVAAMSGDARRALEICRRAAELVDSRLKQFIHASKSPKSASATSVINLIRMADIESSIQEVFQAPHIHMIRNGSRVSKIVLVALVHELYSSGLGEITFEQLSKRVSVMCNSNREQFPGWDTLIKVCCKLGDSRIILCEEAAKHRLQKIQLNYPSDDVAFALKDCPEIPWLARYL